MLCSEALWKQIERLWKFSNWTSTTKTLSLTATPNFMNREPLGSIQYTQANHKISTNENKQNSCQALLTYGRYEKVWRSQKIGRCHLYVNHVDLRSRRQSDFAVKDNKMLIRSILRQSYLVHSNSTISAWRATYLIRLFAAASKRKIMRMNHLHNYIRLF